MLNEADLLHGSAHLEHLRRDLERLLSEPTLMPTKAGRQTLQKAAARADDLCKWMASLKERHAGTGSTTNSAPPQSSNAPASVATQAAPARPRELTAEQLAARDSTSHEVTITAFAGSGKTTTLEEYASARPRTKMLYVAFNKSVATEAQRRFPSNVECKTSHSLAFGTVGRTYASKLGNVRARDVMEFLEEPMNMRSWTDGNKFNYAQLVIGRVNRFLASGTLDPEIGMKGTDSRYKLMGGQEIEGKLVLKGARLLWEAMKDVDNKSISMPHDGYLKIFGLSQPDLSKFGTILLDESQDTTMCVFGLVGRQQSSKVLVGDPHQSIYEFRGATNVMNRLRDAQRLHLTESFRFGQKIADVANSILEVFADETLKIKGAGTATEERTQVRLYRTNAGLFGGVVQWITSRNGSPAMTHLVGGVDGYNLDSITDTWWLMSRQPHLIKDAFLRRFASYEQMKEYAESVQDKELLARTKIVDDYMSRIPGLVEQVKASQVEAGQAQLQFTTAHKSKGLEWDVVEMGPDFPKMMVDENTPRHEDYLEATRKPGKEDIEPLPTQESNLIYVASTRAKTRLVPNEDMATFLKWHEIQSRQAPRR